MIQQLTNRELIVATVGAALGAVFSGMLAVFLSVTVGYVVDALWGGLEPENIWRSTQAMDASSAMALVFFLSSFAYTIYLLTREITRRHRAGGVTQRQYLYTISFVSFCAFLAFIVNVYLTLTSAL